MTVIRTILNWMMGGMLRDSESNRDLRKAYI